MEIQNSQLEEGAFGGPEPETEAAHSTDKPGMFWCPSIATDLTVISSSYMDKFCVIATDS